MRPSSRSSSALWCNMPRRAPAEMTSSIAPSRSSVVAIVAPRPRPRPVRCQQRHIDPWSIFLRHQARVRDGQVRPRIGRCRRDGTVRRRAAHHAPAVLHDVLHRRGGGGRRMPLRTRNAGSVRGLRVPYRRRPVRPGHRAGRAGDGIVRRAARPARGHPVRLGPVRSRAPAHRRCRTYRFPRSAHLRRARGHHLRHGGAARRERPGRGNAVRTGYALGGRRRTGPASPRASRRSACPGAAA